MKLHFRRTRILSWNGTCFQLLVVKVRTAVRVSRIFQKALITLAGSPFVVTHAAGLQQATRPSSCHLTAPGCFLYDNLGIRRPRDEL